METLEWTQFTKVDMRVGTIIKVEPFPEAHKPAFKLTIDFGSEIGLKKSSAQITHRYTDKDLLHRQIIAVINFPPKQIANFMSECLVLGAVNSQNEVVLLQPECPVANGLKIA